MGGSGARFFKKVIILEAGAAIIFFGSLIHHPELAQTGARAISELQARGYQIPTIAEPVRVYPAMTAASFNSGHAGGWYPGVISLREDPQGTFGPEVYLRHELLHEASFRTCAGSLPLWAEEAAAMAFSREPSTQEAAGMPTEIELDHLRKKTRVGADLDASSYSALSKLVFSFGWPNKPCAVSEEIEKLLGNDPVNPRFGYILINLHSGRLLEANGDLETRYPPGSLLKIPFAASLQEASNEAIGEELVASDTNRLLKRKSSFVFDRFHLLTSIVKDAPLTHGIAPQGIARNDDLSWRQYLGGRDQEGNFSFEANLNELALILRASILLTPERFAGLSRNGFIPGSTLFKEAEQYKGIFKGLRAISKTGTVSDGRGNPLVGHLMVAWPQEDPQFLAVFRDIGSSGASTIRQAANILKEWSSRFTPTSGQVRVRLMSLTPRDSWEVIEECPSLDREVPGGGRLRFSVCGRFKILSTARGSRSERFVWGVLQSISDGDKVVLKTDPETYADAVLASEAQDLQGSVREALRAAIVWNGVHGARRHPDTLSLCDSTHCMVFLGHTSAKTGKRRSKTDPSLLALLDGVALQKKLDWFSFSEGGDERWEMRISSSELQQMVNESRILDLRRERTRGGELFVHLLYPETEERVSCEVLRAKLKMPSCPEAIQFDPANNTWLFAGIGKGHGQGLSVERARMLAKSGYSASEILRDAYK
jgi:hypothetical protein